MNTRLEAQTHSTVETRPPVESTFDAEFQPFLYAVIGEEHSGTSLSVLSALVRHGVDPWEQADHWSRLPKQTALRELASLIAALPDGPGVRATPEAIAARLIVLLPAPHAATPAEHSPVPAAHYTQFSFQYALLGAWIIAGIFRSAVAVKPAEPVTSSVVTDTGSRLDR